MPSITTLEELSAHLRAQRRFSVEAALSQKIEHINDYFTRCNLSGAIVGVSGGVDSALALNLLTRAMAQQGSPLKTVVGALVPIYGRGTSAQDIATSRGRQVINAAGATAWTIDLSSAFDAITVEANALPTPTTPWAEGQLASYLRTPALYYGAALLQEANINAIVVGTTNRDEGAYLGFFGKASDAMVDLQPISDLHKHEVYALARALNVPEDVLNAPPSGDVFDGQLDEEMIGAPYWFVSLYLMWRCAPEPQHLLTTLTPEARAQFDELAHNIDLLHKKNAHKYTVGNPSIHLDVYPRAVPGGWS